MKIRIEFKDEKKYREPVEYYFESGFIPNVGESISVDNAPQHYYIVVKRKFDYGKSRVVLEVKREREDKKDIVVDNSKNHPEALLNQSICTHKFNGASLVKPTSKPAFGVCAACGKQIYLGNKIRR